MFKLWENPAYSDGIVITWPATQTQNTYWHNFTPYQFNNN